ncbi:TTL-domain-containing protein [Schizophyllum commune H4-8]|uniref:TTL-domain-containing protein n=1 Tax=Schizophyllum commune (strain H4-8 / FGSC 9210) TaxID=578458 RepID=UPI002160B43C|nr:TTL-domain-containing protein [Schizophyllum commune H4-8]KAI5897678.1 TTL-domain-containing protein [Schizophyllum commune H4-8]
MLGTDSTIVAFVSWPTAPFTGSLVLRAIQKLSPPPKVISSLPQIGPQTKLLQWSTYDDMDHELTHLRRPSVLASSYVIRKALIRKHFLSRTIHAYLTKHPDSILKEASPRTYEIEISYADELDEIFADELYDLEQDLEQGRWWILKPGMADRGNGIRLFNSREALTKIFEDFEDDSEDEDEEKDVGTGVVTSQLRHFVVQEYIDRPLLLDPRERPINTSPIPDKLEGHKFHLRAYCVASGALTLYLYDRILALFSSVPYAPPESSPDDADIDLAPHLTNTSLQTHRGEEGVRLLDELVGCTIFDSGDGSASIEATFTKEHIADIVSQMTQTLSETFKAAMANPVHFQPIPNAFELFGVDFLVQHNPTSDPVSGTQPFLVKVLEINAEPAIELTGPRLAWILEDLFVAIGKQCVQPFLDSWREGGDGEAKNIQKEGTTEEENSSKADETSHLITCLQEIRGA